jgi:hypothetical protein
MKTNIFNDKILYMNKVAAHKKVISGKQDTECFFKKGKCIYRLNSNGKSK